MIGHENVIKSAELFTACLESWRDAKNLDKGESF
jgi:hypothetical protein